MKLLTHLFDEILVESGKSTALYFKNNHKVFLLKQLLQQWEKNKEIEVGRLFFLDGIEEYKAKDLEFLVFQGGSEYTIPTKLLTQWLKYQVQNEPIKAEYFEQLQLGIENFFYSIQFDLAPYEIEFEFQGNILDGLLKTVIPIFSLQSNQGLTALQSRQLVVKLWQQLIFSTKPQLIIYFYPECDGEIKEWAETLNWLEEQSITVLYITKSTAFLRDQAIEQVHLIQDHGEIYDLSKLQKELELFDFKEKGTGLNRLTVELALRQMENELTLLDAEYRVFLQSEKY